MFINKLLRAQRLGGKSVKHEGDRAGQIKFVNVSKFHCTVTVPFYP